MANGPSGLCSHVWICTCRTCGTDREDWPELRSPLLERLELAAQACHAAHLLSCEATCREAIAVLGASASGVARP